MSASAGTGKTEVLVRRVQRLLLAGFDPESILCLTYTKTAAAEMQNRLLKDLAAWATMPDDELREELEALMKRAPETGELHKARRLFARTLEAKGGLKIHTIHGFCERLLQRFPLEAQVTPHFSVLDEQGQALLRRQAFDAVFARAAEDRDGPLGQALARVITLASEFYFRKVIDAVLAKRAEMERMVAYHEGRADWAEHEALDPQACTRRRRGRRGEALIAEMAGVLSRRRDRRPSRCACDAWCDRRSTSGSRASFARRPKACRASRAPRPSSLIFCSDDHRAPATAVQQGDEGYRARSSAWLLKLRVTVLSPSTSCSPSCASPRQAARCSSSPTR